MTEGGGEQCYGDDCECKFDHVLKLILFIVKESGKIQEESFFCD